MSTPPTFPSGPGPSGATAGPGPSTMANFSIPYGTPTPPAHDSPRSTPPLLGASGPATAAVDPGEEVYERAKEFFRPYLATTVQELPLNMMVERAAKLGYIRLRDMIKGLKDLPGEARAPKIIETAMRSRDLFTKLLVLVLWIEQAEVEQLDKDGSRQNRLRYAIALHAWADGQIEQKIELRKSLAKYGDFLRPLQVQNPDLCNAVDVLTTGDYRRAPKYLDDLIPPKPITDEQRTRAIQEMNEMIELRLRVDEQIPRDLVFREIRDGKAYFEAPGLFECALTVGHLDPRRQWYLADIKFLYSSKRDAESKQEPPAIPKAVKQEIRVKVDAVLQRMWEKRIVEEDAMPEDSIPPRYRTLDTVYEILENLTLFYQLETLVQQAMRLARSEWAGNLFVFMAGDRRSMAMRYWSRPPLPPLPPQAMPNSQRSVQTLQGSPCGGTISIRIAPTASIDEDMLYDESASERSQRHCLTVKWEPEPYWLGVDPTSMDMKSTEYELDPGDLDIEALVLEVVTSHAEQLTIGLKNFIEKNLIRGNMIKAEDIELRQANSNHHVALRLYDERWLMLQVNKVTGHLHIAEEGLIVATILEAKLASTSKLANIHSAKLLDVIVNFRGILAKEALEEKIMALGMVPSRKLEVPSRDLDKHHLGATGPGQPLKPILHTPLPCDPNASLLIAFSSQSINIGLVQFVYTVSNPTQIPGRPPPVPILQKFIASIEWFDPDQLPEIKRVDGNKSGGSRANTIVNVDRQTGMPFGVFSFELSLDDLHAIFQRLNGLGVTRAIYAQLSQLGFNTVGSMIPNLSLIDDMGGPSAAHIGSAQIPGLGPAGGAMQIDIETKQFVRDEGVLRMLEPVMHIHVEPGQSAVTGQINIIARISLNANLFNRSKQLSPDVFRKVNEQGEGAVWTSVLDTRPGSARIRLDSATVNGYIVGVVSNLATIESVLQLVLKVGGAVEDAAYGDMALVSFDLDGVKLQYWPEHTMTLEVAPDPTQPGIAASPTIKALESPRFQFLPESSGLDKVKAILQAELDAKLRSGQGLSAFLHYARLNASFLDTLIAFTSGGVAVNSNDFEVTQLNASKWLLTYNKQSYRYVLAITYLIPNGPTFPSGGILITDSSAISRDQKNHANASYNDLESRPIPEWTNIVQSMAQRDDLMDTSDQAQKKTSAIPLDQGKSLLVTFDQADGGARTKEMLKHIWSTVATTS